MKKEKKYRSGPGHRQISTNIVKEKTEKRTVQRRLRIEISELNKKEEACVCGCKRGFKKSIITHSKTNDERREHPTLREEPVQHAQLIL